jgi:hypothetical protein
VQHPKVVQISCSGSWSVLADATAKGPVANRAAADAFPANVLPIVLQIEVSGVKG